jgi:hypothetical protein
MLRMRFAFLMILLSMFNAAHAGLVSALKDVGIYWDEDYFAECKLKHIKPGMDARAIVSIESSCKHKAVPRRCRNIRSEDCLSGCRSEGYWSNKFGDCAKD